jgi:glycosyltransferase involved in cell wall biosynthesis
VANILILGKYYFPYEGGIEQNTRMVAESLATRHSVTALVNAHDPSLSSDEIVNGVRVLRKKVNITIQSQPISLFLLKDIRLRDYDLIHFHAPNPFASILLLISLSLLGIRAKIIITHHMDIYGRQFLRSLVIPFYHALVKMSDLVLVTSRKNAVVSRDLPAYASISVIPLSIRPSNYAPTEAERRSAKAWAAALTGGAPAIGFLGRHARYKGLKVLIEAMAQLPKAHVLIGGDGSYRAEAEGVAQRLNITDRVHFLGRVDETERRRLLCAIDVFAFPSTENTEAFGVALLEAMACGTPVVASDLPTGVTDVAIHEDTALLAIPGSPDSLAIQLQRLLDNESLRQAIAKRGTAHLIATMTDEVVSQQILALIDGVLARPNRRVSPSTSVPPVDDAQAFVSRP